MQENYKPIGDYIRVVNEKNRDLAVKQLIGLSIDKCYIPSVANVIGTDLSTYKIIKRNQFACSLMQVSRDEKIPIACMMEYDEAIMSPAYVIFEIIDESVLMPEYLNMWVMRAEFDREASFLAVGGVRGSLAWDDFCRMKLPVPSIDEQRKIVKAYQTITDRIKLKKQINDNLPKGDAPDIAQMNARVREMLEGAIQSDGIEELFETGKHISVDIFSDEYMDKINAIQLPNTKIKILQRLLSQAIDEFRKINKIMGVEFSERLKRVVDEYNNRRRDEAYANEVLDDVAEKLAALLEELKKEKDSFKDMGIDYEEKAFYDILNAVARKYEFEYPDDKMIELSKRIKAIVDDKSRYTDWSTREDIKANLQVDLILLLDEFDYPPVTIDDVYKEVLEQAENFKKYS